MGRPYGIMTQLKARNAPSRGHFVPNPPDSTVIMLNLGHDLGM